MRKKIALFFSGFTVPTRERTIVLRGTLSERVPDRVEIIALMSYGTMYRVYDDLVSMMD